MRLTRRTSLVLPLLAMPAVTRAQAQGYPSRPVRFIVAYPPGGATDIAARKVAEAIAPALGQPVIVENRPGGSSTIGTGEVVRAQPDGHTLLAMDSSYCMLPYVFARLPWDHAHDLLPVTVFNFAPVVLAVKANARWPDLASLLAEARANPARITYGTGGVGSSLHFAAEDLQHAAGAEFYHIPYKGAGEATLGLLSGTVDLVMGSVPSAMANLQAGTIRALAVCGRQRVAALPNVPTFAEAGVPAFQMVNWTGLAAPKGTPQAHINRLQQVVSEALATERMQQFFLAQGATTGGMPSEEFGKLIRDEVAQWRGVAERAKLVPQ
jgi:tripartite-type tricarboxylate transporter receptor subunit TctC